MGLNPPPKPCWLGTLNLKGVLCENTFHFMLNLYFFPEHLIKIWAVTIFDVLIGYQVGERKGREKKECYESEKILIYCLILPSFFSSVVVFPLVWVLQSSSLVLELPNRLFTDKRNSQIPVVWVPFTDAPFWKTFLLFSSLHEGEETWTMFFKEIF